MQSRRYLAFEKIGIYMNGLGDLGRDWPTGINIVHFDVERVQFLLWKHFIPSLSQRKHFVTDFLVDLRGFYHY